jgi:hypothetical protein
MSNLSLFVVGTLVTLLVSASMSLLIWGAILDGRAQRAFKEAEREAAEREEGRRLHVVDAA